MSITVKYFVSSAGAYLGAWDGYYAEDGTFVAPDYPADATEVPFPPEDGRQVWQGDAWLPLPPEFLPIEPVPFWRAALEILELKKSDVLNALTDPDERYLAELEIEGRKTYRRDDPLVVKLAQMKGYTSERMDTLWLQVQQNYK